MIQTYMNPYTFELSWMVENYAGETRYVPVDGCVDLPSEYMFEAKPTFVFDQQGKTILEFTHMVMMKEKPTTPTKPNIYTNDIEEKLHLYFKNTLKIQFERIVSLEFDINNVEVDHEEWEEMEFCWICRLRYECDVSYDVTFKK